MYAIQTQEITKQFRNGVIALQGVTMSVKQGEIYTLLGPNGAGKSTLINILTTLLKPTSGKVTMFGEDSSQATTLIRKQIACVSQQTSIDTYLSLEENMMFQSRLYQLPKLEAKRKMETLITQFGLEQYRNYPVSSYSGGVKRRLDIALHMMSNPKLLFLDEPSVGMDIISRKQMWEMMRKIRDEFGTTIFLTTHYLEEAEELSDTIAIMKEGRILIEGTPKELHSYIQVDAIQLDFLTKEDTRKAKECILKMDDHLDIHIQDVTLRVSTTEAIKDRDKLIRLLWNAQISFTGIQIVQSTLEDVFLRITTGGRI